MAPIVKLKEDNIEEIAQLASELIHSGGVIIYPTDTVYGIGGDAASQEVVNKIAKIKHTIQTKPLSVMVHNFEAISEYCETGVKEEMVLASHLPGPYTFLLKSKSELPVSKNMEKLGVRIPDNLFCQVLCSKFPRPIITTSANITGNPSPLNFESIDKSLLNLVNLAIDGGPTKYQQASHIVDLVDLKILRGDGGEFEMQIPKV